MFVNKVNGLVGGKPSGFASTLEFADIPEATVLALPPPK
jgi:hypothetical protein